MARILLFIDVTEAVNNYLLKATLLIIFIFTFRWLPADEAHAYLPPRPSVPSQPAWAEGMSYSDVYLTPYPYDYEHNGGRLQQEIAPVLRYIKIPPFN
ncbi:MAG: hypothetical protein ABIK97_00080 [candidate division WOR-3 bacterium]